VRQRTETETESPHPYAASAALLIHPFKQILLIVPDFRFFRALSHTAINTEALRAFVHFLHPTCKDASPNGMPEKEVASYFLPKDASLRDAGLHD
jgi:hypothetical protein